MSVYQLLNLNLIKQLERANSCSHQIGPKQLLENYRLGRCEAFEILIKLIASRCRINGTLFTMTFHFKNV